MAFILDFFGQGTMTPLTTQPFVSGPCSNIQLSSLVVHCTKHQRLQHIADTTSQADIRLRFWQSTKNFEMIIVQIFCIIQFSVVIVHPVILSMTIQSANMCTLVNGLNSSTCFLYLTLMAVQHRTALPSHLTIFGELVPLKNCVFLRTFILECLANPAQLLSTQFSQSNTNSNFTLLFTCSLHIVLALCHLAAFH